MGVLGDNKMKVILSVFGQMRCDLINGILMSTIDIIPIKFSDTLQRTMRLPKSYLPSHTRLLLFSVVIAVASTLSAFKTDITPQEAKNQIDTAKQFLNKCQNDSCPTSSCLPCLLEISAEIDENGQATSVDKNQTLRKIKQSEEELRNRSESADAVSQKGLCGILLLKAGILRHNIIVLNKTIKEKDSAIKKLTERAELAEINYEKCRNQVKRPEDISCPPCPKPQPCDCPKCPPQITCPTCKEPIVCPTCIERDCSACQTQRQNLRKKLDICQAQLKTANDTIKTSTNSQSQAVASINASISKAMKQITEKLSAKNTRKLNATKLIAILTDIEQKAKSNSTIQNQITQYESLVSELIYFIDAATTVAAQERGSKEKLLQNFKKAVGELKQCNDYLHGKGVKSK